MLLVISHSLSSDVAMSISTEDHLESLLTRIRDASNTLAHHLEEERNLLVKLSKKEERYRSLLQDLKKSILDPIYQTPETLFEMLDDEEAMTKYNTSQEDHKENANVSSDSTLSPKTLSLGGGDTGSQQESFVSLTSIQPVDSQLPRLR